MMGLSLLVGIMVEIEEDPEGQIVFRELFDGVHRVLVRHGLPPHQEPEELPHSLRWGCDMYAYSGLQYLRRIAAHLYAGNGLPAPGTEETYHDPEIIQQYEQQREALLRRPNPRPEPDRGWWKSRLTKVTGRPDAPVAFDHLMFHSDCEGVYLPQRFPHVLFADPQVDGTDDMIGSAPLLMEECRVLAEALELDLTTNLQELWDSDISEYQGRATTWQRYSIESYSCLALYQGCEAALKAGAALAFV